MIGTATFLGQYRRFREEEVEEVVEAIVKNGVLKKKMLKKELRFCVTGGCHRFASSVPTDVV